MKKKFPVGMDDFKEIIEQGYYYIDKTLFIKEVIDMYSQVNIFTHPRRFGKSLSVSMLQCFFEKTVDGYDLFEGLKISECEESYLKHQNRYPVISLSLKCAKQRTFELAYAAIKEEISREFNRHKHVLIQYEKRTDRIRKILGEEGDIADYRKALFLLTEILHEHYDQPAIVLIDEYDVPLESAFFSGYYDEMAVFIYSLMESTVQPNSNVFFSMMMGCLHVSEQGAFTGENNFEVSTIMNNNYQVQFGFSQEELEELLVYYGIQEQSTNIKEWYYGYSFGSSTVYNPWSVICAVKDMFYKNALTLRPYWGNTSSNEIIRRLLDRANVTERNQIEHLMLGGTVEVQIHEDITYGEIYKKNGNLWNFMFFTGYLKKIKVRTDEAGDVYAELGIPNKEIQYIYRNHIINWFEQVISDKNLTPLYTALRKEESEKIRIELDNILLRTISYEDYKENFYHGIMLGLLSGMDGYIVKSNREAGLGRYDIVLRYGNITGEAIILELKWTDHAADMEMQAEKALQQIEDMKYDTELKAEGYRKIIKYGICFYKKSCYVKCKSE